MHMSVHLFLEFNGVYDVEHWIPASNARYVIDTRFELNGSL